MRWGGLLLFLIAVGLAWWAFGDRLTLEEMARHEQQLRSWQRERPAAAYGLAFLVYVAVTALMIPGAAPLSLLFAWLFGFLPALLLVSFASTSGATIAFLLSRGLFRQPLRRRFGRRLRHFNRALRREGPFFLLTLRLIPAVPFFVINTVMGLTPMRVWTFWWVSQLGMLPGTAVYVYAGSRLPTLGELAEDGVGAVFTPQLLLAFALLATFPLLIRWALHRYRQRRQPF
jgi:uncharacterized membrane protein YdjX (TVP38/TMEM64 family)